MPNDYYTHGSFPAASSFGSSAQMRSELDTITAGFDKLPALTGNAYKIPFVNSAGSAMTSSSTFTLDANGSLGVGLASPGSRLHAHDTGGGDVPRMRFTNGSTGTTATDGAFVGISNSTQLDVWNFEADAVRFATSNTERMRITSAGDVGIGTASPTSYGGYTTLNLNNAATGTVVDMSVAGVRTGSLIANNASVSLQTLTSLPLTFFTANTERMRIDSTGNVGIGTASPGTQLDVAKAQASGTTIRVSNSSSANGASAQVNINSDATDIKLAAFSSLTPSLGNQSWIYTTTATPLVFATQSNERMRIDSSGNVGIGASPTTRLDVYNASNNYVFVRSAATSAAGIELAANGNTAGATSLALLQASDSNAYLQQRANASLFITANGVNVITARPSGNVGIGQTNPQTALGLASAASISWGTSNFPYISGDQAAGTLVLGTQASERMRIDSSGNVLVGTTTANANLAKGVQIASTNWGSAVAVTASASVGTCAAWGRSTDGNVAQFYRDTSFTTLVGSISVTASATAYNTSSDQRLKTNITPSADAGALLDAVRVRQFDWLSDGTHQRFGFIAQELVEVVPEAVHAPANPDDMMAVDYSKLVPLLVREIQALRARVAALEA